MFLLCHKNSVKKLDTKKEDKLSSTNNNNVKSRKTVTNI